MSKLERERERLMEEEAPDLPFGRGRAREERVSPEARNTRKRRFSMVVLLGLMVLGIPIIYMIIGLGGAIVSSESGAVWLLLGLIVLVALGISGAYFYMRGQRQSVLRDDVGNEIQGDLVSASPSEGNHERRPDMRIREIMKGDPVICGSLDSIYDCAQEMYRHNVGFLTVLDEHDQCVGVITDRDLVCGGIAQGSDLRATPITTIMERNFQFLQPDQSVEDCLLLMKEHGVRRLPVLDGGKIVGLVSVDDLIVGDHCTIEDLAAIFKKQLAEPSADHGLNPSVKHDNRAA